MAMISASRFAYISTTDCCPGCNLAFSENRPAVDLGCSHTLCLICSCLSLTGEFIRCAICEVFSPATLLRSARIPDEAEEEPPTNVFKVVLNTLTADCVRAAGAPICRSCGAILNCYSKVRRQGENALWVCEFSRTANQLNTSEWGMPTADEVLYVLDSKIEEEKELDSGDRSSVIFCLDISGSMGTMEQQAQPVGSRSTNPVKSVTRLDCVRQAVKSQLETLSRVSPSSHVGLITFSDQVQVVGDGSVSSIQLPSVSGMSTEEIRGEMSRRAKAMMSRPVTTAKQVLIEKLNALKPRGGTALGPGLIAGIELAVQAGSGSRVIICTDGLANEGVGKIEGELSDVAQTFYNEIGVYAQQKGISVSVISIASGDCKLSYLSYVADLTEGRVLKVDPANLDKNFSSILEEKIIATEVSAVVILHKALKFKNESEESLQLGGSKMRKVIGNVTEKSEFTFEYSMKTQAQLATEELENLKEVPFQLLLEFKTTEGQRMLKCITKVLPTTTNATEARQEVDATVIATDFSRQGVRMVQEGRFSAYRSLNQRAQRWARTYQIPSVLQMQQQFSELEQAVSAQERSEVQNGIVLREEDLSSARLQLVRRANMTDSVSALVNQISRNAANA